MFASTNEAAGFSPTKFLFPSPSSQPRDFGMTPRAELSATLVREGDLWLAFGCGKSASPNGSPALYLFGKIESLSGIFRSDDEGRTWLHLNDADHQFGWITRLTGDPRVFGRVYLATTGRGIIYGEPLFQ
jgi:hypothetical protein